MVYFYCVDVKYESENLLAENINLRASGVIKRSRIENIEQFDSVFKEIKNDLFTAYVQPIYNSASIEDCIFILTSFNPL